MRYEVVTIIFDPKKGKLRAQAPDGGWVRFPVHLRTQEGAQYEVDLQPGKSGSWIAVGKIHQIANGVKKVKRDLGPAHDTLFKIKRGKKVDRSVKVAEPEFDFYEEIRKVHGK